MTKRAEWYRKNLAELNRTTADDPRVVDLVLPDIGGGKLSPGELAKVEQRPNAVVLRVSGLQQQTFEMLVERCGRQFPAIHSWKCPRVADLSAIEDPSNLTHSAGCGVSTMSPDRPWKRWSSETPSG